MTQVRDPLLETKLHVPRGHVASCRANACASAWARGADYRELDVPGGHLWFPRARDLLASELRPAAAESWARFRQTHVFVGFHSPASILRGESLIGAPGPGTLKRRVPDLNSLRVGGLTPSLLRRTARRPPLFREVVKRGSNPLDQAKRTTVCEPHANVRDSPRVPARDSRLQTRHGEIAICRPFCEAL